MEVDQSEQIQAELDGEDNFGDDGDGDGDGWDDDDGEGWDDEEDEMDDVVKQALEATR